MAMSKPNILFILSDQHSHRVLGHAGHPDVQTPHLDKLAGEGARCRNAITQNPICTPSRMCWISGQYAHNHGYYGLSGGKPEGLPTLFGHFRSHRYRTVAMGKIHCPEYWVEDDCDVFHETCGCSIGGRSSAYHQFLVEQGAEHDEDHGRMPEFPNHKGQPLDGRPSRVSYEVSQEGWLARESVAEMRRSQEAGQPFCMHVSLPKPHQVYAPAQEFWDLYDEDSLTLPPNADIDLEAAGKAPHLRRMAAWSREGAHALFEPKTFEAQRLRKIRAYLGQVSHVDHAIGEIMTGLDDLGLRDDTIVIYSTDHGEYVYEFGISEKAPGICADSVCRIPMLVRYPKRIPAGIEVDDLVETVDLVNTLCAFAGVPELSTADGYDVSGLLCGDGPKVRDVAVTEFAWSKSITNGRYRLVHYAEQHWVCQQQLGFGELYDLEEDPWEMRNRYDDPELAQVRAQLQGQLLDWLMTTTRNRTQLHAIRESGEQWQSRYNNSVNADGKFPPRLLPNTMDIQPNYL
jgi:choline-sulfatase/uncharacterized sulfatase